MGLTAGPVPARVDATVKAGLLDLLDVAVDAGWSTRRAALALGVDLDRVRRWRERHAGGELADRRPGAALHGLLPAERDAILALAERWGEVDRSHRKLAHRGSRLGLVHASESTVLRVLAAEGLVLPGRPARDPGVRAPWPDWVAWKPNSIWAYDFTHFSRARRVAVAVLDVVSRRWLSTVVSAEETSTQIEVAFTAALADTGLDALLDTRLLAVLRSGGRDVDDLDDDRVPVLLAMSDNGPQMRSHSTREFMAACAIMQRFGRPSTPTDQAWIESLFGHVKGEWPHLERIRDPGELVAELDRVRGEYTTVRLHAGIGYVTPDDEHNCRGDAIRQARRDGLAAARAARLAYRRRQQGERP
ncbi:MAG TPA: DDE-type integrase/transposase/recombinase [Frankiaceae bacterium]|nr:DDE-type integrase/transposase/recombinase [Frankiaceae bacterium]